MRNYILDTKMLPKVWVTWATYKNGNFNTRVWLNCQTGNKKEKPESWMLYDDEASFSRWRYSSQDTRTRVGFDYYTADKDKIWVGNGSSVKFAYAKYHADINRLEVAVVGMDTTREAAPHHWKFLGDRFFIGKDKSVINQNGEIVRRYNLYEYHTAYSENAMLGMLLRLYVSKEFVNEFKKFIGGDSFAIGNGSIVNIDHPYNLQRWYTTSQKARSKGKQQKITDDLVAIELSDTSGLSNKYPPKQITDARYGYRSTYYDFLYYERINDNLSVLRAFARNGVDNVRELWRMYLDDKDFCRIVAKSDSGWVPSRQIKSGWRRALFIANEDEAIEQCNRIKYILKATDKVEEGKKVDFLITALRFPEIEQLVKFGYVEKCVRLTSSHYTKADLKSFFGGYYNEKEKNVLRKIGMTKSQLDHYMSDSGYYNETALKYMREIFGNDLSSMDYVSFVKYFNGSKQMRRYFWRGLDSYRSVLQDDSVKFFKNMVRLSEKAENAWTMVNDTLTAYTALRMDTQPAIDWCFDDISDLVRAHDAITALKRTQDAERRAQWDRDYAERLKKEEENRIKLDKKRKEYEYEDDTYIIRLPKDSAEIVREGATQHICIGGYTSRHANGDTNLFFLRKKDQDETPFYAIEMNNLKNIIQIHGFGNKWLGNDPEAIPTVVRWLRKNDIACDEKILTCKATGYGATNQYVKMPVVD